MGNKCCYGCARREAGCHSVCEDYKRFVEERAAQRQKEREEREIAEDISQSILRWLRRKDKR